MVVTADTVATSPFEMIPIEDFRIPPYQPTHRAEDALTQGIIDNFDPLALGVFLVSRRDDAPWVLDGQRRLAACKARGYDRPLPCYVFTGLTETTEARLWRLLDRRGNQHVVDLYRGMVMAKSPKVAVDIERVIRQHGFQVDFHYGPTTISAVKVLEVLHLWGSLPTVLTVIRGAWQGESYATKPEVLMGLGAFDYFYRDAYLETDLMSGLRIHSPLKLLQEAQAWRREGRGDRYIGRSLFGTVAIRFQKAYNDEMTRLELGRKFRLPEFRQPPIPNDKLVITRPSGGKRKGA